MGKTKLFCNKNR